ncbi:MAG: LacI family transcriptional regulator [Cytophagaceae bacterium]|nr:MAG: LacI family transcriptional regulator [Cytophagaceae bacterium]
MRIPSTMITMTDIATKVGVSRATVSHVLTDYKGKNVRISESTRQRILETAAEMGYRPNQLARSVASGKIRMIGYLVDEPDYEPYWNTIIGSLAEAEELGFALKVLSVKEETLAERIQQCIGFRLGGLIVRVNNDKSLIFEEANRAQMPVVVVDEGVTQPFGANVVADDAPGCSAAIEHLTHLGHTRIAFISSGFPQLHNGLKDIGSSREELFRQAMQRRGLAVPDGYVTYETMFVFGQHIERNETVQSAIEATQALLDHPQGPPTAIFCWRDETAMIAIRACRGRGLRVPEDISVVGFSDLSSARFFDPPLTTVKSPWNELGRMAMRQVVQRISEGFTPEPSTHVVPSGFIIRQSTGPASL